MKNLKRVLALVTVFAMVMSVSAFAAVTEDDINNAVEAAVAELVESAESSEELETKLADKAVSYGNDEDPEDRFDLKLESNTGAYINADGQYVPGPEKSENEQDDVAPVQDTQDEETPSGTDTTVEFYVDSNYELTFTVTGDKLLPDDFKVELTENAGSVNLSGVDNAINDALGGLLVNKGAGLVNAVNSAKPNEAPDTTLSAQELFPEMYKFGKVEDAGESTITAQFYDNDETLLTEAKWTLVRDKESEDLKIVFKTDKDLTQDSWHFMIDNLDREAIAALAGQVASSPSNSIAGLISPGSNTPAVGDLGLSIDLKEGKNAENSAMQFLANVLGTPLTENGALDLNALLGETGNPVVDKISEVGGMTGPVAALGIRAVDGLFKTANDVNGANPVFIFTATSEEANTTYLDKVANERAEAAVAAAAITQAVANEVDKLIKEAAQVNADATATGSANDAVAAAIADAAEKAQTAADAAAAVANAASAAEAVELAKTAQTAAVEAKAAADRADELAKAAQGKTGTATNAENSAQTFADAAIDAAKAAKVAAALRTQLYAAETLKQLKVADNALESAKSDKTAKESALTTAQEALNAAKATAGTNAGNASDAVTKAQEAVNAAIAALEAAQKAYDDAEAARIAAEEAAEAARRAAEAASYDDSSDDDTPATPVTQTIEEEATPLAALPEELAEISTGADVVDVAVELGIIEEESYVATEAAAAETVVNAVAVIAGDDFGAEEVAAIAEEVGVSFEGEVTRNDLVVVLFTLAEKQGYDVSARASLDAFTDADKASEAMAWAVEVGLINGVDVDKLDPTGTLTQEQLLIIIARFMALTK